jgi:hypothetical protein
VIISETPIDLQLEADQLKINYQSKTSHVIYSIGDFAGNVRIRGLYHQLLNSQVDVSSLPKGTYTFCLVDGDILTKHRFVRT